MQVGLAIFAHTFSLFLSLSLSLFVSLSLFHSKTFSCACSDIDSDMESYSDAASHSMASEDGIRENIEASASMMSIRARRHDMGMSASNIGESIMGSESVPAVVASSVALTDRSILNQTAPASAGAYSQTFEVESNVYSATFEADSVTASRSRVAAESVVQDMASANIMESMQEIPEIASSYEASQVYSEEHSRRGAGKRRDSDKVLDSSEVCMHVCIYSCMYVVKR
jgi:hypothetical protein